MGDVLSATFVELRKREQCDKDGARSPVNLPALASPASPASQREDGRTKDARRPGPLAVGGASITRSEGFLPRLNVKSQSPTNSGAPDGKSSPIGHIRRNWRQAKSNSGIQSSDLSRMCRTVSDFKIHAF